MEDSEKHSDSAGPIYHEISPKIVWATRIIGGCAVLMVILAFIFCLVQGSKNQNFYLLACNIIISAMVGGVNAWWYRKGDLTPDKFWYLILVAAVIMFQCLATDIFVFNLPDLHHKLIPVTTTPTSAMLNFTTLSSRAPPVQ